jgi:purine-binding chemotaxis protein CheW
MVVCRVAEVMAAIPIEHVIETMRPLPLSPFEGLADPFEGIAVIRGKPAPVLSARRLLGLPLSLAATRFVVLRAGSRTVALAVDSVVGIRALDVAATETWPELAVRISAEKASSIGLLDRRLLMCLQASRLIDEATWQKLASTLHEATA